MAAARRPTASRRGSVLLGGTRAPAARRSRRLRLCPGVAWWRRWEDRRRARRRDGGGDDARGLRSTSTDGGLGTAAGVNARTPSAAAPSVQQPVHFVKKLEKCRKSAIFFFKKRLISHFYQVAPKNWTLNVVSAQTWVALEHCRAFANRSWPWHWDAGVGHPSTQPRALLEAVPSARQGRVPDLLGPPLHTLETAGLLLSPRFLLRSFFMENICSPRPPHAVPACRGAGSPSSPRVWHLHGNRA